MPVTAAATLTYMIKHITLDMTAPQGTVVFFKMLDGQEVGQVVMTVDAQSLMSILDAVPQLGMSRQLDFTSAIYNHAVASGVITGAIS